LRVQARPRFVPSHTLAPFFFANVLWRAQPIEVRTLDPLYRGSAITLVDGVDSGPGSYLDDDLTQAEALEFANSRLCV
jgi:hypothetical protein